MTEEIKPQWTIERIYTDLDAHIVARNINECIIEYEVRNVWIGCPGYDDKVGGSISFKYCGENADFENAEILVKGSIKWDGCSDNRFGDIGDDGYIHGCGRFDIVRIGKIFDHLFDIAKELIPTSYDLE